MAPATPPLTLEALLGQMKPRRRYRIAVLVRVTRASEKVIRSLLVEGMKHQRVRRIAAGPMSFFYLLIDDSVPDQLAQGPESVNKPMRGYEAELNSLRNLSRIARPAPSEDQTVS
jgi:hypothetical protein